MIGTHLLPDSGSQEVRNQARMSRGPRSDALGSHAQIRPPAPAPTTSSSSRVAGRRCAEWSCRGPKNPGRGADADRRAPWAGLGRCGQFLRRRSTSNTHCPLDGQSFVQPGRTCTLDAHICRCHVNTVRSGFQRASPRRELRQPLLFDAPCWSAVRYYVSRESLALP